MFVALESNHRFLYIFILTGANSPLAFLLIIEILALPSKVAIPYVVHFWLIATDCNCECLPKSAESEMVRLLMLLISTIIILSFAVPATKMGNWKSEVKILF